MSFLNELYKNPQGSEKKVIEISESEFFDKCTKTLDKIISEITEGENDIAQEISLKFIGTTIIEILGKELFKNVEPSSEDGNSKL